MLDEGVGCIEGFFKFHKYAIRGIDEDFKKRECDKI